MPRAVTTNHAAESCVDGTRTTRRYRPAWVGPSTWNKGCLVILNQRDDGSDTTSVTSVTVTSCLAMWSSLDWVHHNITLPYYARITTVVDWPACGRSGGAFLAGDVTGHRERRTAVRFTHADGFGELRRGARHDGYRGALGREGPGNALADTATSAGDDCDLSCQPAGHSRSFGAVVTCRRSASALVR